jgi:hypothetical protein
MDGQSNGAKIEGDAEATDEPERALPKARWGWTRINEKVAVAIDESAFSSLITHLPGHKSSVDAMRAELIGMSADCRSHLLQDELGPTRADRALALEIAIAKLDALRSRLRSLNLSMRSLLSDEVSAFRSPPEQLETDFAKLYDADKIFVETIAEVSANLARSQSRAGRMREANQLGSLACAAQEAAWHVFQLDDTTDIDVALVFRAKDLSPEAASRELPGSPESRVRRLSRRYESELLRLREIKGAESRLSFELLAARLCDLYSRQTAQAVTANPFEKTDYKGYPQTKAGRFVFEAMELLMPAEGWNSDYIPHYAPISARLLANPADYRKQAAHTALRERAVHTAMRGYVTAKRLSWQAFFPSI